MLNVHQLNVFMIAAETLNFTQTAKRLHLTQSSVSQHIKSLENQLGVDLFLRRGRTLEITNEGQVLLPLAREIVEGSIRATEKMELLKKEIHGNLIVGCNTAPGKYMLPIILSGFHGRFPMVRISCKVFSQAKTIQGLREGTVHFALINLPDEDQSAGEFKLFLEEPIVLLAPKDHSWAKRKEIEPEELYEEVFITREETSGTYANVKRGLTNVGIDIEKLDVFLEMGTSEAIVLAVEEELGVGFVSRMILDKICPGRVAIIKVKGLEINQSIYFGKQTAIPATGAQAAFWDFVREMEPEVFDFSGRDT